MHLYVKNNIWHMASDHHYWFYNPILFVEIFDKFLIEAQIDEPDFVFELRYRGRFVGVSDLPFHIARKKEVQCC